MKITLKNSTNKTTKILKFTLLLYFNNNLINYIDFIELFSINKLNKEN